MDPKWQTIIVIFLLQDIVDSVTIALPYIAKTIVDGFKLIGQAVTKLYQNPQQAISAMSNGLHE